MHTEVNKPPMNWQVPDNELKYYLLIFVASVAGFLTGVTVCGRIHGLQ